MNGHKARALRKLDKPNPRAGVRPLTVVKDTDGEDVTVNRGMVRPLVLAARRDRRRIDRRVTRIAFARMRFDMGYTFTAGKPAKARKAGTDATS
uniref:Uncharacterized protein n=1 Tax=uncultured organism TaxID=155900 RepID=A0A7L9QBT5_9ZZZZ|nr:hypothetical protein [uncultured organism]